MYATMDLANSGNRFKGNDFHRYVGSFHTITSSAIVFLHMSQGRTQGVFRDGRQGIRAITRASRATHLITNVGVRRSNGMNELVNSSACQAAYRAYGAGRSVLNGVQRGFGRVTIICRSLSSVFRVVEGVQIYQGSDIRGNIFAINFVHTILLFDFIRVVLQRRQGRFTSARRRFFFNIARGVDRSTFTTIDRNAARFFLTCFLISGNLRCIEPHRGRITLFFRRGSGIHRNKEMTNAANAKARGNKSLEGRTTYRYILVGGINVSQGTFGAFLCTYAT